MDLRDPSQASASMIDRLCKPWARHVQVSILLYFPSLQRQSHGSMSRLCSPPALCFSSLCVRCPVCLQCLVVLLLFIGIHVYWAPAMYQTLILCSLTSLSTDGSTCLEVSTSVLEQAFCMPACLTTSIPGTLATKDGVCMVHH